MKMLLKLKHSAPGHVGGNFSAPPNSLVDVIGWKMLFVEKTFLDDHESKLVKT